MIQAFKGVEGPAYPKKELCRSCHDCGQEAIFKVWFQGKGFQRIERLCNTCLQKSVIIDVDADDDVPTISK
jgi:hypothetical protein